MDAPKCKICGKQHWPRQGCVFAPVKADPQIVAIERTLNRRAVALSDAVAKPGFDKRAYQREYMRKRRAAAKGDPK